MAWRQRQKKKIWPVHEQMGVFRYRLCCPAQISLFHKRCVMFLRGYLMVAGEMLIFRMIGTTEDST